MKYTVLKYGLGIFGSKNLFGMWLLSPNKALGGATPMKSDSKQVHALLRKLQGYVN